jgi:membrane associated rhomboid family serine protease
LTLNDLTPVACFGDVELGSPDSPPTEGVLALQIEAPLWVDVAPLEPAAGEIERAPPPTMRIMLMLTVVAGLHLQVLVGILAMGAFTSRGVVPQTILSNVGDLYASQPWRPLLAVYSSSSIAMILLNMVVQQACAMLLLRRGTHWAAVLTMQLVPALAANLLTSAFLPSRALCGATTTTTALLVWCMDKNYATSRNATAVYALVCFILFIAGLQKSTTNIGHLYAIAWATAHRSFCRGGLRRGGLILLVLLVAPPLAHVVPRNVRALDDAAISSHVGPACVVFGCGRFL